MYSQGGHSKSQAFYSDSNRPEGRRPSKRALESHDRDGKRQKYFHDDDVDMDIETMRKREVKRRRRKERDEKIEGRSTKSASEENKKKTEKTK